MTRKRAFINEENNCWKDKMAKLNNVLLIINEEKVYSH